MGRKTTGIKPEKNGFWKVDKQWRGRRLFRRGFISFEEAEIWLIAQLQEQRAKVLHGLVCNAVAQSVIEAVRGQHPEFVFVYRRERKKRLKEEQKMAYRPISKMNNTGWRNARKAAGLGDLHVHDLRHTAGMRLREAGLAESTIADVLWHTTRTMTAHYSMAQLVELHRALVLIEKPAEGRNKSLVTLREEAAMRAASHAKVTQLAQRAA